MVDHTPTPWCIDEENCGDGANITSQAGRVAWTSALRRIRGGERIIEGSEAKANAAFIVRAVNTDDDLVAALTGILSNPGGRCTAQQWQAGLAALAKANAP